MKQTHMRAHTRTQPRARHSMPSHKTLPLPDVGPVVTGDAAISLAHRLFSCRDLGQQQHRCQPRGRTLRLWLRSEAREGAPPRPCDFATPVEVGLRKQIKAGAPFGSDCGPNSRVRQFGTLSGSRGGHGGPTILDFHQRFFGCPIIFASF